MQDFSHQQHHDAEENDIAALCLSFLICQSLRYHTGGHLPDPEGNEPPATRPSEISMLDSQNGSFRWHKYRERCWMTTRMTLSWRHLSKTEVAKLAQKEKLTCFKLFTTKKNRLQIDFFDTKIESLNSGRPCCYCAASSLPLQLGLMKTGLIQMDAFPVFKCWIWALCLFLVGSLCLSLYVCILYIYIIPYIS